MEKSLVEYMYDPEDTKGHRCGYCKSEDTSISHGMWSHFLTVEDYQDLIDRGWRRSGKYCYKPIMDKTCCPMYTISCQAAKFRLSKSQKAVLKKMNRYLLEGQGDGGNPKSEVPSASATASPAAKKPVQPGKGADPTKPVSRKAKVLRKEVRESKESGETAATSTGIDGNSGGGVGVATSSHNTSPDPTTKVGSDGRKPLEAFLTPPAPPLQGTSGPGGSNAHRLEITLVRSNPPSETFKATTSESYALYKKYQMAVHGDTEDKCKESGYKRFLCDSPLIARSGPDAWGCGYGSYHQHYRIDGKLVAVGVIDILPKCLSSVYLYYDPDHQFLNLGVYSALRELEMVRRLNTGDPEDVFKHYYMGYYIHTCQKMRYKGGYTPSFLLCPESYRFVPIAACLPRLECGKYARLEEGEAGPAPEDVRAWLGDTLILHNRKTYMSYAQFRSLRPVEGVKEEAKVMQYARLAGPKVAARMLLII